MVVGVYGSKVGNGVYKRVIVEHVDLFCFFFQAEDGIRDLVRSRGLGDVYKRQGIFLLATFPSLPLPKSLLNLIKNHRLHPLS